MKVRQTARERQHRRNGHIVDAWDTMLAMGYSRMSVVEALGRKYRLTTRQIYKILKKYGTESEK